jgi:hypothetical protein
MKHAQNIGKIVKKFYLKNLHVHASREMDERIIGDALNAMEESKKARPASAEPGIWRIIMKSHIAKIASAALIILAVAVGITFFRHTAAPTWAIEQTIEALKDIESIYISGYFLTADAKKADFQAWIIPSQQDSSKSAYFRFEAGRFNPGDFSPLNQSRHVVVVSERDNSTYVYFPANTWTFYPNQNIAYISEGLDRSSEDPPCIGSDFFEKMKRQAQNWNEEYGKDEETGKDSVFVTCTHPSRIGANFWWIQFDVDTKLPVSFKLWWNQDYSAEPAASVNTIIYNPTLPDGIFEFYISEQTKVLDHRILSEIVSEDPTYGIDVNELNTEEACKRIVSEYWEAIIEQDWQKARRMRPLADIKMWRELNNVYVRLKPAKLLSVRECINMDNKASFPIVPCLIRMQNGLTKAGVLHVSIEQVGDKKRGVIVDSLGTEFADPR